MEETQTGGSGIPGRLRTIIFLLAALFCLCPFVSPPLALLLGLIIANTTGDKKIYTWEARSLPARHRPYRGPAGGPERHCRQTARRIGQMIPVKFLFLFPPHW